MVLGCVHRCDTRGADIQYGSITIPNPALGMSSYGNMGSYKMGQTRCSVCQQFLLANGLCPCCSAKLREKGKYQRRMKNKK